MADDAPREEVPAGAADAVADPQMPPAKKARTGDASKPRGRGAARQPTRLWMGGAS
jgi:hypothetical protein